MAWQNRAVMLYQNHAHILDASVDAGVSSPSMGVGWELENVFNLIPERPGRFATATDTRYSSGAAKVLRIVLNRSLTIDTLALINLHSHVTLAGAAGDYDSEKRIKVEPFYGSGSPPSNLGSAIGSGYTLDAALMRQYGNSFYYVFTGGSVTTSTFTIRFTHSDASAMGSLSIGNVLLGRSMGLPGSGTVGGYTSGSGWFALAPLEQTLEGGVAVAGRGGGALQIETRTRPRRRVLVSCRFDDESIRADFEGYIGNRDAPRTDGVANQLTKRRLDAQTVLVGPYQWAAETGGYGYPIFGHIDLERGLRTVYDSLGRPSTQFEYEEIV